MLSAMKHRRGSTITIRGRKYKLVTEPEPMPDGLLHATLEALTPLPGEPKRRPIKFQPNGDFEWDGP